MISGGTTGRRAEGAYAPPNRPGGRLAWRWGVWPGGGGGAVLCSLNLHGTASKPYVDLEMDIRTFYVTQDREKPNDLA